MTFKRQHTEEMQRREEAKNARKAILKTWLLQHPGNPYPSEDQKMVLAEATGLTIPQISKWFANGRRRILLPIIERYKQLNPGGEWWAAGALLTYL